MEDVTHMDNSPWGWEQCSGAHVLPWMSLVVPLVMVFIHEHCVTFSIVYFILYVTLSISSLFPYKFFCSLVGLTLMKYWEAYTCSFSQKSKNPPFHPKKPRFNCSSNLYYTIVYHAINFEYKNKISSHCYPTSHSSFGEKHNTMMRC